LYEKLNYEIYKVTIRTFVLIQKANGFFVIIDVEFFLLHCDKG